MKLQKQSDGSDTQQRKENIPASIPVKEPPSLSQQATSIVPPLMMSLQLNLYGTHGMFLIPVRI